MARRQRKPSRAFRRAHSVRPPRASVLAMVKLVQGRLEVLEREIRRVLFPVLSEIVTEPGASSLPEDPNARTRVDASIPNTVQARLSALDVHVAEIFDEQALVGGLDVIGKRVSLKNKREIFRVVGISLRDSEPGIAAKLDNFRAINVGKIKSLAGQELVDITKLLSSAEASAKRVEVLEKEIEEKFGVTRSRAKLLARDQVLKLNAQIAKTRQQNLGVEEYIWTTSGDERVRGSDPNDTLDHVALDGNTYSWNAPPDVGDGRRLHPGEDYQCRCTAYPVIPELA